MIAWRLSASGTVASRLDGMHASNGAANRPARHSSRRHYVALVIGCDQGALGIPRNRADRESGSVTRESSGRRPTSQMTTRPEMSPVAMCPDGDHTNVEMSEVCDSLNPRSRIFSLHFAGLRMVTSCPSGTASAVPSGRQGRCRCFSGGLASWSNLAEDQATCISSERPWLMSRWRRLHHHQWRQGRSRKDREMRTWCVLGELGFSSSVAVEDATAERLQLCPMSLPSAVCNLPHWRVEAAVAPNCSDGEKRHCPCCIREQLG